MRPRIALTLSRPDTPERTAARARYVAALEAAGAEVIPVEPGGPAPAAFDGLCLAGGEDVEPARYGAEPHPRLGAVDAARDATELALVTAALAADVPVLGICRGLQVLNVALGGALVQHVEGHEATADAKHEIVARPHTLLAEISGTAPFTVNSRHHQAVTDRELAPNVCASACVGELVEALESTEHRFVLGVQWHPERTAEVDPAALRIFDAFVAAAREPVASR
ncbi:MAG TPA: gamma-glutamyl-gamma-aminobutyrate hydrolase family protein [Candidatus Limnocylindria bacterium]|nr:gamma-glutamyl-gamma-aminobutyrate hydrolase family protein [Candidatus Limnocylindria bacterium]